jgi:hypothetical protein
LDGCPPAVGIVEEVLAAVAILTFILFLRGLARFIGRNELVGRSTIVIVYMNLLIAGFVAIQIAPMFVRRQLINLLGDWIGLFAIAVVYLVGLVLYANLITFTRKAILAGPPNVPLGTNGQALQAGDQNFVQPK